MRCLTAGVAALALAACETADTGGFSQVLGEIAGAASQGAGETGALSSLEIDRGLREALTVGTNLVAARLGATDGYFADPQVRIPLPGRLAELQSTLGGVGLSAPLDDLELRMNRAAEAAVPEAKRLVLDAVRGLTIKDARQILNGGDAAATDFLRARTETSLEAAFTPHVETALAGSGAFNALDRVAAQHQLTGVADQLRGDLVAHAVGLGLDGVFLYIAEEERKIREDPVARTSEILRRVFGTPA